MEKIYIGTKIIAAEPMDQATFSLNVRPFHDLVEIGPDGRGKPGYKVRYEDGYISWSPKETFERAYRGLTAYEANLFLSASHQIFNEAPGPEELKPKETS